MPVKVSDIDRLGGVLGLQEIKQSEKPMPTKKNGLSNVDELGNVLGLKKKVGTNETLSTESPSPSKSSGSQQALTEETEKTYPEYESLLDPFKKAREFKPSVVAPLPTPKEQLELASKNIMAKQEATKKSIDIFNRSYGTDFDHTKVLSNPDEASRFLKLYKDKVRQTEFDINSRLQPQNIIASSESFAQPLRQSTPTIIPGIELLNNANVNEKLLSDHVVDLTVNEGRLKGHTKNQVINNIYKRIDPKGFERTKKAFDDRTNISTVDFLTGDNPLLKNNVKDFELLNTEKAPYEFAYNESLKRQANQMQVMGTLKGDKTLIDGGNSIAAQVQSDDEIYSQYPSLNKSRIAADISKELAEKTGQLQGSEAEGVSNILNKFRGQADPRNTEAFKKYINNPTTRDAALQIAANPDDYISDPSFLGGIGENVAKPFKELFHSVGDITGLRDKMDRLSDARKEELFPEITPELKNYVSKIKGAVNTTAYLTGIMALQIPGTALGTQFGLATKGAQRLGTAIAFGIPSFDGNLKDADIFLGNDASKVAYATLGAMINTAGGEFLELGKISKFKEIQTPILDLANKITDKTITEDAVNELLNKAKNPFINAIEKYGTNVGKGAATMAYFTFANGVNKMLFGGEGTSKDLVENTGTAFMDGLFSMSVLGAFGAHADLQKEKNTSYKQNIYNFSLNPDASRDVIETAYRNGDYDRPTYNEKISILNASIAAKNNLSIAEAGNSQTLNEGQRAVYVTNRTTEAVIKKQLESPLLTEQQKGVFETQIKRLKTQRENILKGLDFNDNLEPLDKIFEAQQEYKKAYEDFNEGVVENDIEVMKAKQNLEVAMSDYSNLNKTQNEKDNKRNTEEKTGSETGSADTGINTGRTNTNINATTTEATKEKGAVDEGLVNDMSGLSHADWFLKNKDKFSDEEFNRIKDNLASDNESEKQKAVDEIVAKKDEIKNQSASKTEPLPSTVKSEEVKYIIKPSKPISEMNSDELYNHAIETRKALNKQDKEFENKSEKEKNDAGYYNVVDNVEDLRDAAQRVNFVENSENIIDLAKSIKSVLNNFDKNNPSETTLAVLNAANKKAGELGIDTNDLIKEVIKSVGEDYKDKQDAEFMMRNALDKITAKSETKPITQNEEGKTLTENEQSAIDAIKGRELKGSVKNWTDILQDENAPIEKKKLALKELSEQLGDPESEGAIGAALGQKISDAIYKIADENKNISSQSKSTTDGKSKEGNGKEGTNGEVHTEAGQNNGESKGKDGKEGNLNKPANPLKEGTASVEDAVPTIDEGGGGKKPPSGESGKSKTDNEGTAPQRKFTKQVLADEAILPKAEIAKKLEYIRQTNAMSIGEASKIIDQVEVDEAFDLVMHDKDVKPAVRVVLGEMLIKKFNNLASKATDEETRNYYIDKTIQAADFVTEKLATEPGQMIQAFSLYSRLSPEAQLRSAIKQVKEQSKKREERRKSDVDEVSKKLNKANEETVDELTKSKKVKKSVEETENKRIKSAKTKIEKAKQRRQDLLKKRKDNKGNTPLYSTPGLTVEGIEFVGNLAKTYIDEGVANVEIIAEKIRQHLIDLSGKEINDEVNKNISDIVQQYYDSASNIKIASELKELEKGVHDIIQKHFTISGEQKKSLTKKFIDELGLSKEDAEQLSKEIETEFDQIATRKKQAILEQEKKRFDRIQNGLQGSKKVDGKTLQDDIIKYSNLGAFDNNELLGMLSEKLGTGQLTPEQGKEIERLAEKIQKAPEGSPKNDATQDLLAYRANLKGTSWGEVAQGVWYANVLSGYLTHVKNIVSTFFNGFSFFATEAVLHPESIPVLLYGGTKGVKRGLVEAWHTITTGRSPIHVSKVETPQVLERIKFQGGLLNPANYLKYVGRLMVAEDVLQFQGLKEMRATQLAYREAAKMGNKNPFSKEVWKIVNEKLLNTEERYNSAKKQVEQEGFTGNEGKRRTYELMEQSRPIQMQDDAYGFAAKGTFNHDTEGTLGALTNAISHVLDIQVGGVKPLRFLIPFTRIITNVANNTLDFSPIGLVRAARGVRGFESFQKSHAVKNQYHVMTKEERQQTIVKAALGISSMASLYALSSNGTIQVTGAGPSDIKKRIQLIQEGWQPYSIKVGDTYYSYKLTPMVFAWGLVGSIRDHEQYDKSDNESLGERVAIASWDGVKNIGDMTWVGSAAPIMSALSSNNPGQVGTIFKNMATNTAKGFILPNFYTQGRQKIEQIFNMPEKQANNLFQSLIKDVPIARNSLNDKINALGDPIVKDIDILASTETQDQIWKFLLDKKGWVAPVNKNTLIVFDDKIQQDRPVTEDEYYEFSKSRGQKIKEGIKNIMDNGAYTTVNSKGENTVTTNEDEKTGTKQASELTSYELNKLLTSLKTKATKATKKELFVKEEE